MSPLSRSSSLPSGRMLVTSLAWCSLLGLGACGGSPAVRYFTLQGPATESCVKVPGNDAQGARSVQLVGLTVPDGLDRPQLVFRTGDSTLSVNEHARWAEPLKSALSGALALELSRTLGCAPVVLRPTGIEEMAWKLSVDVQRLDVRPGQDVVLEAVWSLRRRSDGKAFVRRSVVRESLAGEALEAAVAAQSRAVAGLARDIARLVDEFGHSPESGAGGPGKG
ncbi:MAG: PqiC family protein [Rhodocyclaceae bacterium]|nr:PqiC family protein [Rhodocyclaceae bacterium]